MSCRRAWQLQGGSRCRRAASESHWIDLALRRGMGEVSAERSDVVFRILGGFLHTGVTLASPEFVAAMF